MKTITSLSSSMSLMRFFIFSSNDPRVDVPPMMEARSREMTEKASTEVEIEGRGGRVAGDAEISVSQRKFHWQESEHRSGAKLTATTLERFGNLSCDEALCESFHDRGLSDTGGSGEDGVVLV